MIDERLQEIQDGKAREILEKHDNDHRDKAIMCVGVNWELCSREDLLDIVDVWRYFLAVSYNLTPSF
jgi:Fanconi-associated nuclease 1